MLKTIFFFAAIGATWLVAKGQLQCTLDPRVIAKIETTLRQPVPLQRER